MTLLERVSTKWSPFRRREARHGRSGAQDPTAAPAGAVRGRSAQRILVTSTSGDALNTNHEIRNYLSEGFREILPATDVAVCPLEMAADAISQHRPTLVVAVGSVASDDADLRTPLQRVKTSGARLAFWLHDDPYEFDYHAKVDGIADHVFTNDRWAARHYETQAVTHLPMAASRTVHYRPVRPLAERELDLFFCGVAFDNRIDVLTRAQPMLARRNVEVRGAGWPPSLAFARNERLTAGAMAERSASARYTLNVGRTLDIANERYRLPASTPGPRTFETALSGSAQLYLLTGLEILDYFEPDSEIALFDDVDAIEDAIARSYREPEAVCVMAERAQARVLGAHTYRHRAETILATLSA